MCSPWYRKKGVIFLTTKVLILAKIGGVFFLKKSVKRGIFSVRGTSMVTIKQRESDARYNALVHSQSLANKTNHYKKNNKEVNKHPEHCKNSLHTNTAHHVTGTVNTWTGAAISDDPQRKWVMDHSIVPLWWIFSTLIESDIYYMLPVSTLIMQKKQNMFLKFVQVLNLTTNVWCNLPLKTCSVKKMPHIWTRKLPKTHIVTR